MTVSGSRRPGASLDYRLLFEAAPARMAVLDRSFHVVAATNSFLQAIRTARADAIGAWIFDVVGHQPDGEDSLAVELRPSLTRVLTDGVVDTVAPQMHLTERPSWQGGGSETRYLSMVNVPVLEEGHVAFIIHCVHDVTDYVLPRQDDVNRISWAAEEAKSDFVSRVSRELRTPLNTVFGFGELLALSDLSDEQHEQAAQVVTAAKRLGSLMEDILDISRMSSNDLSMSVEAVPAAKVIADAMELIRPVAVSHDVQVDPPPESDAFVLGDEQRLRQALMHLLTNAVKYNHPSGRVSVSVGVQPGGWVRLSVADTGRGIAEPDIERLFVPFQRLDAAQAGIEGTGLGLALCRQLAEAMGGRTGVTSTQGVGSTFWVELPATVAVPRREAAPQPSQTARSHAYESAKTLMYVEDMVENLRLVEHILRQRPSVRIVPAMLGRTALDLAAEHHPDMILLDLHLPDMDGEELLHRFQADPATRDTPVVVLSADADADHISRLLAAGAVAYVTKPIRVRNFLSTIDHLLGQPHPLRAVPRAQATESTQGSIPAAMEGQQQTVAPAD